MTSKKKSVVWSHRHGRFLEDAKSIVRVIMARSTHSFASLGKNLLGSSTLLNDPHQSRLRNRIGSAD